jgi:flagellar hook-length control protein FliK
MTVQTIDKRVVPEANMTALSQDKLQAGVSAEDAFLAVLQQTTQRFAGANGKLGGLNSGDKVLSEHITRLHTEVKVDARQEARQEAQPEAKDARPAVKADKSRGAGAGTANSRKNDETAAAPVQESSAGEAPKAEAADAGKADQDASSQDDAAVQSPVEAKPEENEQVIIAIDVTITETVQIIQVDTSDDAPMIDLTAQAVSVQMTGMEEGGNGKDPLAGFSADDRQRIADLQSRLISDVEDGDMEDALDAATELVNQMIAKVGQHKAAAEAVQAVDQQSLIDEQARDLASLLSGSNVHLDIKVQTRTAESGPVTQNAAPVVEALSLLDLAAQAAAQGEGQDPQAGQGFASDKNAGAAVDQAALAQAQNLGTDQVAEVEVRPFTAMLAAQAEASVAKEAAPENRSVAGLANVGSAQAADKASAGQAAHAARTPRSQLQAQVMEQVSVQISKQVKDGADTIKIQLKPHEMGKIEIKLEVHTDGRVSATVTADRPETLAMLQKDAKGLEKALEDAGLKPDSSATSFSLKGGEQQQNADRNNNTRSRRGRNRGEAAGEDVSLAGAGAAQAARQRTLGGRSGVDISV